MLKQPEGGFMLKGEAELHVVLVGLGEMCVKEAEDLRRSIEERFLNEFGVETLEITKGSRRDHDTGVEIFPDEQTMCREAIETFLELKTLLLWGVYKYRRDERQMLQTRAQEMLNLLDE